MAALFEFNGRGRPLHFVLVATLAMGWPVWLGTALGDLPSGITASMGAMIILYMRRTSMGRRIRVLLFGAVGFQISYLLGLATSYDLGLSALSLALTVVAATWACRFIEIGPPGNFFFILVACIARAIPYDVSLIWQRAGMLMLGSLGACLVGLVFGFVQMWRSKLDESTGTPIRSTDGVDLFKESLMFAVFVAGGYWAACLAGVSNPYWVPISCAAVMQGASLRALWHRKVHRIVGTAVGMALAWVVFLVDPGPWALAGVLFGLSFMIEALVSRNYGLAVVFITALTVIYADVNAASLSESELILTRFWDSVWGSVLGYLGGWTLYLLRAWGTDRQAPATR